MPAVDPMLTMRPAPAAPFRQHCVGHAESCHQRDVDIALPRCRIGIYEQTGTDVAADIIDEHGDWTELFRRSQYLLGRCRIEYVRAHEHDLLSTALRASAITRSPASASRPTATNFAGSAANSSAIARPCWQLRP